LYELLLTSQEGRHPTQLPTYKPGIKSVLKNKQMNIADDYVKVALIIHAFTIHIFCISAILFQYYEKHQYPICGQILKCITCIKQSPHLSRNVMQMISLASKNSNASLTSKWQLLHTSNFRFFSYMLQFSGTQTPYIISHPKKHFSVTLTLHRRVLSAAHHNVKITHHKVLSYACKLNNKLLHNSAQI
jgi:hypothetical protein